MEINSHTIVHKNVIEIKKKVVAIFHQGVVDIEYLKTIYEVEAHVKSGIMWIDAVMYLDGVGLEESVADRAAGGGGARGEVDCVLADKASSQHLLQTDIFGTAEQFDFFRHPSYREVLGIEED